MNIRAIEAVGTAKVSLVSGITFMCQLSGSAVMLAINTVIFATVSAKTLRNLLAVEHVPLTAAENTAVESILRGAGSIHELPAALARETGDAANLVARAYSDGLQVVLYLSAALVFFALLLTMRYVPRRQKHPAV